MIPRVIGHLPARILPDLGRRGVDRSGSGRRDYALFVSWVGRALRSRRRTPRSVVVRGVKLRIADADAVEILAGGDDVTAHNRLTFEGLRG